MKGKGAIKPAPAADLLVCFPSRANFALWPKPICSPGVPSPDNTGSCRRLDLPRLHHRRSSTRGGGGGGQASPLFRGAKPKQTGSEIDEPTSPKVTCSGQIKVRPRTPHPCKSWQSVMEEMERMHSSRKHKRPAWLDSLGVFKKDVMQFLTCLQSTRLDLRCFGAFSGSLEAAATDNEDGDEKCRESGATEASYDDTTSRTMFSKWFMVLQENQNYEFYRKDRTMDGGGKSSCDEDPPPPVPPPNALLLMRCRSAPVKRWPTLARNEGERDYRCCSRQDREPSDSVGLRAGGQGTGKKLGLLMKEEDEQEQQRGDREAQAGNLAASRDDNIATDRRTVSGIRLRDPFARSRSWKI
ncbi:hypothetical protein SAY86_000847 [Trapa natans]|uniref:Uncharacterized protein n=1 Tax=Trapa natans TaxID=22666 RepID=A0AAN7MBM2_TRANT|nr:hypothetical protein SAY86_000847 [Trapa natans]